MFSGPDHLNGWFWFSPENVSQPGTAVFTLRMTWKNYQLIDDVTLRVLRLPFNTYKKTSGEIVLGEDYDIMRQSSEEALKKYFGDKV